MKVLLIGNYQNSQALSMIRFAELMLKGLVDSGHQVKLLRPPALLGRVLPGDSGFRKWVGYADQFVMFLPQLYRHVGWADVIHICDQANAIYIPHLRGRPHVVTCHDLFAIRAAFGEINESPTSVTGKVYQRWILEGLRRAHISVCVSQQTMDEVARVVGLNTERLRLVPNALNYPYTPMPEGEALTHLRTFSLDDRRPFFIHVGGNQWYKNRAGVLRIYSELTKLPAYRKHHLVMAGKPWTPDLRQVVKSLGLEDRVFELTNVTNEDLRALYSTAEALLFPSLQEGFGWPVIEAQACGCPVITSNRPPMTDVAGTGGIFINPENELEAAESIAIGLANRERLRGEGFKNVRRYSQTAMIEGYLGSYQAALMNPPHH